MSSIVKKLKAPVYAVANARYNSKLNKVRILRDERLSAIPVAGGAGASFYKSVSFKDIKSFFLKSADSLEEDFEFAVFSDEDAICDGALYSLARDFFKEHPECVILYCDSFIRGETPTEGFFKPDWSPEFFKATFYTGGMFALRKSAIFKIWDKVPAFTDDPVCNAVELFAAVADYYGAFQKNHSEIVGHISKPLVYEASRSRIELYVRKAREIFKKTAVNAGVPRVSALILTKDHPDLFKTCFESLKKCSLGTELETVLVDNGSNGENKALLSDYCAKEGINYIYHPCDFNFSKLCNIAAKAATGDFFLFCNDDVEFTKEDTVKELAKTVDDKAVGLCGCKLLYPDGRIQHAGVFNVLPGPMHKLQFAEGDGDYYFGFSKSPVNVLSVTAACVMVRKDVFIEAGGFDEEFAVAFNDVALGFKIHSLGYRNVCRNDVTCIHKESVTRGSDALDKDKTDRLIGERNLLYNKFPNLRGKDPYLNPNLDHETLDGAFNPAFLFGERDRVQFKAVRDSALLKEIRAGRNDLVLNTGMEYCGAESDLITGGRKERMVISGYCFVNGYDNGVIGKKLLLVSDREAFEANLKDTYRPDLVKNVPDQKNPAFGGFSAEFDASHLPEGRYEVYAVAFDRYSRLKLVRDTGRRIYISK